MQIQKPSRFFTTVLSVSALAGSILSGCGGGGPEVSDAVVTPAPDAVTSTPAPATPTATAPTASTPAAEASTAAAKPAPTTAEGWGTLKGRVVFDSAPPQAKTLVAQGDSSAKDAEVCAKTEIKSERLLVNGESKGVQYAIVFFPKPSAVNEEAKSAVAAANVEFDQQNCVFKPHVLAIMAGSKLNIKSSDPVGHNVNSKVRNSEMNQQLAPGQTFEFTPPAPSRQPGKVTCDIHPWMEAYWLVLDNPYFAVTDAQGNFEIKNAPAGTQKVAVWQEAVGFVTPASGVDINIEPDKDVTQEFTVESGKVKG